MRTTLTLDDDVAAMLQQLRKARGDNFKALVNEALRAGLKQLARIFHEWTRIFLKVEEARGKAGFFLKVDEESRFF
jgi:hypothetical protein